MGRVLEHVVVAIGLAGLDLTNLLADRDQRIHKPIQLALRLALRGLDHQRARHGERDRRRMESVVDQPLGDILDIDARRALERTRVDDALVGDEAMLAGVQQLVMPAFLQPARDVVGAENRHLRGERQAIPTHHRDVGPRDRQNGRASPWRGRHRARALGERNADVDDGVRRQMWHQMFGDPDRPHAGTAAAVRNAERLVQVEMADVRADVAWAAETDLRVHVRAVHVNLPAVVVDDATDLFDGRFEDAVGRRVRHHQRAECRAVLLGFCLEIGDVDVALWIGFHDHDLHSRHDRARRVRTMRRLRNQARRPVCLTAMRVIRPNHEKPGELSL